MKVTFTQSGDAKCILNQLELRAVATVAALTDQLAHHYRDAEFGQRCEEATSVLKSILTDKELHKATK